ncbi:hypothetical protein [Shewanella salipaludis]|uniref:Uncharacterized protein n=1 Tax=Shewanella salipaludis TaxID=2723052 RepID=A0A972FRR4_9GAMM|nr:hypothetical protein [Shewanella salipaludis]NMH64930.1 hypothetical protein [Shewanella salipaludis]
MLYQLTRPFSYLTIKGMGGKKFYDIVIPFTLMTITVSSILYPEFNIKALIGENSFIAKTISFTSGLPGFFIAALAAIATFKREGIDEPISSNGESPYIFVKGVRDNGNEYMSKEIITRRVFLCMLFSFLTAQSFILIIGCNIYTSIFEVTSHVFTSTISSCIFTFMFYQIVVTTFFGLYYLGDRIHH